MIDLQNNLQTIQQKLATIILEIQKIDSKYIVSKYNIQHNAQLKLLKDLLHVLNIAAEMLDTILFSKDKK